ncbi:FERM and PDZ domain-containing protein 1 [Centroberyx affinis]|uniref:FERM and PDZ domain-containing protein 1 n=1 Tax=Centroberyx affinis TaxID=166261 RepID=UPI003A5BD776
MEERDRSRSPSRRTSRVEQVVGRWLRRSRDLGSRERVQVDGKTAESSSSDQRNYPFRFNVQIQRDSNLNSHGLTLSSQTPILVQDITQGGPADGRLVPGDQLVKINNVAVDDLTPEQAAELIRECQDTVTMTVLRTMMGPKSSFITPEKRAKLKSNPVKVRFAEEVEVNGHSQGNSLLFLPNVLKVYLENGQTKAFKFEPSTTVKDIVMTLKEKLSLCRIEHFSLVLEQQHSITKLLLLHDEERIQQVVQKKEAHDYRCLFRVCFMPKNPQDLLLEDPTAFEYLYLQGVNDVLQERFAVEMRCNTALRLAALHIQERLASCGQSPKTNLKMITKTWGIENFVSSTLLRNMREKDLRKAIGYHMKKSQSQQDPKQKSMSVNQARTNYLEELSELKSFGGKSFSATMMLQDRESMVTLLVGARYGVSQVVNHKLSIMTMLTEFTSITRIELLPESDRVSLVKIYMQDIKPITLLLESVAAKDMSCLIAGYCRVFVEPNLNIFPWTADSKKHRVSAEEGYVSRRGSDSDSSDLDMDALVSAVSQDDKPRPRIRSSSDPEGRKRKDRDRKRIKDGKEKGDKPRGDAKEKEEKDADTEKEKPLPAKNRQDKEEDGERKEKAEEGEQGTGEIQIQITDNDSGEGEENAGTKKEGGEVEEGGGEGVQAAEEQPSISEASDSCHVLTSPSSDSLDALEEDDLISCSSSSIHSRLHPDAHLHPSSLHPYPQAHPHPHLLTPPPAHSHPLVHLAVDPETLDRGGGGEGGRGCRRSGDGADPHLLPHAGSFDDMEKCSVNPCSDDSSLCFAELSRLVDYLPSPPEASEEEDDEEEELRRRRRVLKEMDESVRRAGEGGGAGGEDSFTQHLFSPSPSSASHRMEFVFNFEQRDASCYYKLCTNVTPDSAHSLPRPLPQAEGEEEEEEEGEGKGEEGEVEGDRAKAVDLEPIPILHPPPGFGDSSSDEEFFDARDRFTSPEDPTSGALPRDLSTEMKLDFLSTLSLSDIGISVAEVEGEGKEEEDMKRGEEEGGGRETLFQLRKRSRKRRSFMETDFTSRVSYPEPDVDSNQDLVSQRLHKNLLAQTADGQMLSSDPEPSEQTQNPCPTVSSLTHSEGEPAQLESKPILSKSRPHGPGSQDQNRDSAPPSRAKKQEMEMEPDSMESKSVTDLVKVVSPSITVVRCRVEPDGKESADRRGDGKEEGEGQEQIGEREGEKEDLTGVSGNGPFTSHMFLPEIIEEEDKGEETGEEGEEGAKGHSSSTKRPLIEPPSPTHFLFQTCSPSIMGRLSASTLRGKIQRLPLYLSRSQETLNQVGLGNVAQSPSQDTSRDDTEITIKITDVHDVTKTMDLEIITATEAVESDDSDATVTGSEVDGEFVVETTSAEITRSTVSEVKETKTPVQMESTAPLKPDFGCSSVLASGCESVVEGVQIPLDACGCPMVYTNCFSGGDSFDDELTVYEFSCRTQSSGVTQTSGAGLPLMTTPPVPSFLSTSPPSFPSSSLSPSFPRSVLFSSSASELSPLLSPLSDASDCFLSQTHKATISRLGQQRYPEPPAGFQILRGDVDQLLSILEGGGADRSVGGRGGRHPRDTCPAHFTENKRALHVEARRLMAGCQKVVGVGQSPEEMLLSLADSFRTLVELAGVCLWFSGCDRCDRRNAEAVTGLADVARSFRDFCLAAERASGKRSCQDLSTKLLAKQCTALTASVFCLTQLFRTLTAL